MKVWPLEQPCGGGFKPPQAALADVVPDGRHGFDVLDHTAQSRHAVIEAVDLVSEHLLR
jgi:hypothetical protein